MTPIDKKQFEAYGAQGYNLVPVIREVLADLDTPVSAYLKLANTPYSYLLESVHGGEKWGRYSIIGLPAETVLWVREQQLSIESGNKVISEQQTTDPLGEIETYKRRFKVPQIEGLPRFTGGLVGYFGYDTVRYIEPRLDAGARNDPLGCPDIMLMVSDRVVVFDNVGGKLLLIVHADPAVKGAYEKAQEELDRLAGLLKKPVDLDRENPIIRTVSEADFISSFAREKYEQAVRVIKDYIIEGDVMQVVLSQRLSIPFHSPPLDLYRALRTINPSPYMYYFHFGEFHVAGASPEILVRLEDGVITVRPIAGTRPRGKSEQEDKALEQDLLADAKEIAEHLMLIDLGRNDVGRVAETGSVKLTEKMIIERYSHVMHIVSNVSGRVKGDRSALDVLQATFPAGTLSGAPKIRAMEIIDELEPVKRGIYGGAVGYLSWEDNMDTAIAIRTAVIKENMLHIQAGGGIVADSIPANEWEESMNKARAIFRAVSMAERGMN